MTIGLVIVSHSARIAAGVVELAAQMAAEVTIAEAGGTDDGGIGTSFELVQAGIERADSGDGAVLLCDLGSAVLTAETALDFLDDEQRMRVRIAEAPIVEGAVAAAVAAATGARLEAVLAAAESAGGGAGGVAADAAPASAPPEPGTVARTVTLVNRDGLHARPAAEFVKLAATFGAEVTVQGADARSLLAVMALGLRCGAEVRLEARGPGARAAVDALAGLVESGFGEA